MPAVSLIAVPYELGRLRDGLGRGPEKLLESGAAEALAASGATVETDVVELTGKFSSEIAACFELIRQVGERVKASIDSDALPVVLSGNCCFAALGVIAGLADRAPGVVWFDAHGDFNTPETTVLGYFDGMTLATLTGSAWQGMLATVPGARPLPESAVVLAGARDLDDAEERRLLHSELRHLRPEQLRESDALAEAMAALDPDRNGLYLHVDLDVLDREEARANLYSAPGGISADELGARVEEVLGTGCLRAVGLTAYDPECDSEGRVPPIAVGLLRAVALSAPILAAGGPSPPPGPSQGGGARGS